MLKEMGMKALNLEMSDRVCRMEYSVFGHTKLLEKVTGISVEEQKNGKEQEAFAKFCKEWDICMHWSILVNSGFLEPFVTKMGHAEYAEGGTDFNSEVHELFTDEEDVYAFDPYEKLPWLEEEEIIRRFMMAKVDYKKGKIDSKVLERSELLMKDVGAKETDRRVVLPAREYALKKQELDKKYLNVVVMALELPDGTIVTGRSSRRMVAAGACILNAVKKLAGLPDPLYVISPEVFSNMQNLKVEVLHHDRTSLNVDDILTALSISADMNENANKTVGMLSKLNGCKAHCTAILSDNDEQTLRAMGIDVTCDPEYLTTNLYLG
jgi:hypothetical protein